MEAFPLYLLTGQAFHFGVSLFVAIACLAAAWLCGDAWSQRRVNSELFQCLGFLTLTAGFLVMGTNSETGSWITVLSNWLRLIGYIMVTSGALMVPIQPRPNKSPSPTPSTPAPAGLTLTNILPAGFLLAVPLAASAAAVTFWRRAQQGLERHLRPLAISFGVLALGELLNLGHLWINSPNPLLQAAVGQYSGFWLAQQIIYSLAATSLGIWVWRYLIRRPQTQIFFMTVVIVTAVTLLTTVSSVSLTMANIQNTMLASLQTSTSVLRYRLDSQGNTSLAAAKAVSQNAAIMAAVAAHDHAALSQLVTLNPLANNQYASDIILTGVSGDTLYRASDPDRYGDLLATNSLVNRALTGATATGTMVTGTSNSPALTIATALPVSLNGTVIGTVLTAYDLNNAFVDGLKKATSLDSTIYAGDRRVATTLTGPNGLSRDLGVHESSQKVRQTVIEDNHQWGGTLNISNRPYLMSFLPLSDIDNNVIGMLSIGQPQSVILATASQAITYTRLAAIGWIVIILLPIYILTRQISRQLR